MLIPPSPPDFQDKPVSGRVSPCPQIVPLYLENKAENNSPVSEGEFCFPWWESSLEIEDREARTRDSLAAAWRCWSPPAHGRPWSTKIRAWSIYGMPSDCSD